MRTPLSRAHATDEAKSAVRCAIGPFRPAAGRAEARTMCGKAA